MNARTVGFCRLLGALLLVLSLAAGCARGRPILDETSGETTRELAASPKIPRVQWVTYFEALSASSREQRRILMIYFTRDSCHPCDMMEKWTFTDPRVVRALEEFIPVRIKGDVELQIIRRFRVETFPTIIFAELEEGEIDRKAGYRDADFLLQWLKEIKAGRNTLKALEQELDRRPEDLKLLLKQAHNFVDADELKQAFELARKAADVAPGDADVLALFGLCFLRLNKLEAAEAAVTAALQTDARNEEARRLKTTIFLKRAESAISDGDYARAVELLSAVMQIDPENFDARMGMGHARMEAGETEEAFAEFQAAASLRPSSPAPRAALGELYRQSDNDLMAEKEYLRAIEIEPRYEPPYFRLMELYEKNGRRNDLMKIYEKILPIESAGAHNEIAWLMATSKHPDIFNPEAAIEHANAAVELQPQPWYIDTLAEAYYAQGEYELAVAIIKEAMAKEPKDIEYYRGQLEKFQTASRQASSGDDKGKE
jgi:tetratricopeptide (TPR) repeat protein